MLVERKDGRCAIRRYYCWLAGSVRSVTNECDSIKSLQDLSSGIWYRDVSVSILISKWTTMLGKEWMPCKTTMATKIDRPSSLAVDERAQAQNKLESQVLDKGEAASKDWLGIIS